MVAASLYGLYDRDDERGDYTTSDEAIHLVHVALISTSLAALAVWLCAGNVSFPTMLLLFSISAPSLVTSRGLARSLARRRSVSRQNTLIIGAGAVGQMLADKFEGRMSHRFNLVGFIDDDPPRIWKHLAHIPVLGGTSVVADVVRELQVSRVVVAFSVQTHDRTMTLLSAP